jgi:hypothetical protein
MCWGSDLITPSTAKFDRTLDRAVAVYSPGDLLTGPLLERRRVLPVSQPGDHNCAGGFGIRSRLDLMARAFAGCLVRACESFFDADAGSGVVLPGSFLYQLRFGCVLPHRCSKWASKAEPRTGDNQGRTQRRHTQHTTQNAVYGFR